MLQSIEASESAREGGRESEQKCERGGEQESERESEQESERAENNYHKRKSDFVHEAVLRAVANEMLESFDKILFNKI